MTDPRSSDRLSTFSLRRRTPGTFVLVPSSKQGRSIRCQGQLEAATAQILTACPLVQQIEEQPLSIWYAWKEESDEILLLDRPPTNELRKQRRCTYIVPDFLVTMQSSEKRFIEVKPSAKLVRADVHRKLAVGRLFAERHSWSFQVVTENELYSKPLLANIRLLNRFRHNALDGRILAIIEAHVARRTTTLADLMNSFTGVNASDVKTAALHLVAVGRLDLDLIAAPVSDVTQLFPGGTFRWDPFDSVWGPSGSTTNGCFASSANSIPAPSSPKT
jgi:hypothetical protein